MGQCGVLLLCYKIPDAIRRDLVPRDADAIVSGDGETWIKGYRSLNPRSGRLPANGEPQYAGFLSVELRDTKGETLWSYLVTLGPASENISKDLSKQIVRHLMDALK